MKNVVLTGFMGTGKSSVGVELAERLGYRYRDLDCIITDYACMSVNRIFAELGELHFRDLETRVIEEIADEEKLVISTGGGAVIRDKNRELLRSAGVVINLVASAEEIYSRLQMDCSRPLLKDDMSVEKITKMLEEREPFYADSDIRIDTAGKKVEDVVLEILLYLKGMMLIEDA
jgi:shikimate kinase